MGALERARAAYGTGAYDDATIEFLFPEVKESEDERIRKELLEVIRHCYEDGGYALCTDDYKKYSAYLEKQKVQKPAEWSEEDEKMWKKTQKHLEDYIREFDPYHSKQGRDVGACLSWLKSLKNRGNSPKSNTNSPSWKPSEEQMKMLESLPGLLRDFKLDTSAQVLEVLREQLKKL